MLERQNNMKYTQRYTSRTLPNKSETCRSKWVTVQHF